MLGMAITSFFCAEPSFSITTNIIAIFVIVAILLVFDTIESLSISNVLTLKKKVKEKETEVARLSSENIQLRNQFISMSSTFNNKMSYQFNFGDYGKGLEVKAASKDEIKQAQENDSEVIKDNSAKSDDIMSTSKFRRAYFSRELKQFLINKFVVKNSIDTVNLQKEIKITGVLSKTDPLIDKDVMYDAYLRRATDEIFIQTSSLAGYSVILDYRIYFMISRIYHYSKANQIKAKLVLLVPRYSKEFLAQKDGWPHHRDSSELILRLKELYSPAIENGWLEIEEIDISKEEIDALMDSATIKE